jgi:1-acyl-sn-glycerol-3-phosphate acyltransferase
MNLFNLGRVLYRAPIALLWTEAMHTYLSIRRVIHPSRWRGRASQDVIGAWGKGLAWIMGVRIIKRNQRDWPMGDVIISNHMGFLDVPVILSAFPSVFIIKMEMRKVFHFGKALETHGHVFVERGSEASRRSAREGVARVLENNDRIIVFPEGRASPGAKRLPFKPFCFFEAQRQQKRVEMCVIDYIPDRDALKWDIKRSMVSQLIDLIGRRRTYVSIEFFPSEVPDDPDALAQKYHGIAQQRLEQHDEDRLAGKNLL